MLSPEDNQLLTRVGPGTPAGGVIRHYWIPVLLSSELADPDCPTLRVRLLGEDLIAFRDSSGQVGVLGDHCPHRGASLFFGRSEEEGLRCVYHGWKFDRSGACMDMPNEPPESNFKHKIRTTSYPCRERNGVIWTYMGPSTGSGNDLPGLPEMEWNLVPVEQRYVSKRVQYGTGKLARREHMRLWTMLFVFAAAVACGPASQPAQTASTNTEAKPAAGGVLRVHERLDPFDWDITFTGATTPNTRGIRAAYDTLLDFKSSSEVNFSDIVLMPGLAERWEGSADGKSFTFHLNKSAKWANLPPVNGRALTSADVKWGLEYLARIGLFSGNKPSKSFVDWAYAGIASVETPDAGTAVVKFNEPNGAFLGIQATAKYAAIMPREIFDKDGNFKDQMAGSGPFQLDAAASQKGTRWVFKKNPDFYRDGQPFLDEIRWLVLPEESTAFAAFKTQQVDLLDLGVEPDRALVLKKDNPNAVAYRYVEPAPNQFFWNVTKAPMSDVRVRRVIQLSINRDEFVQTFAGGEGAWGLSGAIGGLFSEGELKSIIKYDPNEAKKLLADAGFPNGLRIEQLYAPERGARYVEELQLLQAQLKKTGIDMQLVAVARNDQSLAFRTGDFQTTSVSNANFAGDIGDWIYSLYMPDSVQNFNKVNDPKLTEVLTKLGAEPDPTKRKELVRQGAKYIYENALGLAIYHSTAYQFWQPQLKGFAPNYWRRERSMVDAWLSK